MLVITDVILGCMLFSTCNIRMEVVLIEPLILKVVKYDIMILFSNLHVKRYRDVGPNISLMCRNARALKD